MISKYKLYKTFGRFFPQTYKKHLEEVLRFAGEKDNLYNWLGASMALALLLFFIPYLYSLVFYGGINVFVGGISLVGFIFGHLITYMIAYYQLEDRTKLIEKSMPDWLQLMAANVRTGMTPFKAMKLSARKEFGPLKEEIDYATSKALGTEGFSEVLLSVKRHVRSDMVDRTFELLSSSLKSGGKLAVMLEDLAREVGEMQRLKEDMVTSTKTYSMFIFFTVLVGAPLLLAISVYFLGSIIDLQTSTNIDGGGLVGDIAITVPFFYNVAIIFMVLTGVFSSILVGVIKEGKYMYGLRYSPLVIAGSVALFFVFRTIVTGFLG
jgi:archaeal flagellar protein FlaJ